MESKPKKRLVRKVRSATQEPPKSPPQDKAQDKPTSAEALIRFNGDLIESLFASHVWKELVLPVLHESVASVSGRFTNGRYWHGSLTTNWKDDNPLFVAGYQKALMDFNNNLHDFIVARNKLNENKKIEKEEKTAPIYNPFMEDLDGAETQD